MVGKAMNVESAAVRRGILAAAMLLMASVAILHHLRDLALRLSGGAAGRGGPSDFELILCGGRHPAAPYVACAGSNPLSGFLYPPPSTVYMRLIDLAGTDAAFRLQTGVSIMLLILSVVLLARMSTGARSRWVVAATMAGAAAIAPVGNTLYGGHINIMLLASFVVAWAASTERPLLAGIAAAAGFWLKLYPAALIALFVMRRRDRRAILWLVVFVAAVPLLLLPWVPASLYGEYFGTFLPRLQRFTAPGDAVSIVGVALHWQEGGMPTGFHAVEIPLGLRFFSMAALGLGALVAMAHRRAIGDAAPAEPLALLLATLLLASPLAWSHHFVLALPLVFVLLGNALARPGPAALPVLACWLALLVPGWTLLPGAHALPGVVNGLYGARYPIALLVMMVLLVLARRDEWRAMLGSRICDLDDADASSIDLLKRRTG
jgi:uncharacterized membrane protein